VRGLPSGPITYFARGRCISTIVILAYSTLANLTMVGVAA